MELADISVENDNLKKEIKKLKGDCSSKKESMDNKNKLSDLEKKNKEFNDQLIK